jgi:hypothetical protein
MEYLKGLGLYFLALIILIAVRSLYLTLKYINKPKGIESEKAQAEINNTTIIKQFNIVVIIGATLLLTKRIWINFL